jgi:hypothetical protein
MLKFRNWHIASVVATRRFGGLRGQRGRHFRGGRQQMFRNLSFCEWQNTFNIVEKSEMTAGRDAGCAGKQSIASAASISNLSACPRSDRARVPGPRAVKEFARSSGFSTRSEPSAKHNPSLNRRRKSALSFSPPVPYANQLCLLEPQHLAAVFCRTPKYIFPAQLLVLRFPRDPHSEPPHFPLRFSSTAS